MPSRRFQRTPFSKEAVDRGTVFAGATNMHSFQLQNGFHFSIQAEAPILFSAAMHKKTPPTDIGGALRLVKNEIAEKPKLSTGSSKNYQR